MNIGQLVFALTPTGGWAKTHSAGRVTREADIFFSGVGTDTPKSDIVYALDYSDGVYILSRTLKKEKDVFNRETRLTHGYIFYDSDWKELFGNYSRLLNINTFIDSHEEKLTEISSLPDTGFDAGAYSFELKGEVRKLISCIFEAIIKKKNIEIIIPTEDINCVKTVMSAIYSELPLSVRRLLTFTVGNTAARYLINFTTKRSTGAGIFYSLTDGSMSKQEKIYEEFAEGYNSKKSGFIDELEALIGESVKRVGHTGDAIKDAFEKKMYKSGKTELSEENPFKLFVDLTSHGKYKDPVYAKQFCALLERFIDDRTNISDSFPTLCEVYDNTEDKKLKKSIEEFVAKTLILFDTIDFSKAIKDISRSDDLRRGFLKLISKEEEYKKILAKYLNMFFLENGYYENYVLPFDDDKTVYKEAEKLFASVCDMPEVLSMEILKKAEENDYSSYSRLEKKLAKEGKTSVLERMYTDYFLEKAESYRDLKDKVSKMESLGIPTTVFIKASMKKFVIMCINELKDNEKILSEVRQYAKKGGIDCEDFVSDIKKSCDEEYWKTFEWKNFKPDEDYSDHYIAGNQVSETVKKVSAIAKKLSYEKCMLCDAEPDYIRFFGSEEFISSIDDRISILEKLSGLTDDYDIELLKVQLLGKSAINSYTINDYSAFERYVTYCLKDDNSHMLQYDKIRKHIYKLVSVMADNARDNRRYVSILELMDKYSEKLTGKPGRGANKNGADKDYSKIGFMSVVLCAYLVMLLARTSEVGTYVRGFVDALYIAGIIVFCIVDAIWQKNKNKNIKKIITANFIIALVFGLIFFAAASLLY